MTKPSPQPHSRLEYLITEEELQMIAKIGEYSNNFFKFIPLMVERIRSRPITTASDAGKVLEALDNFFGRLETAAFNLNGEYIVTWADIDCLYGEFRDELRRGKQP